MTVTRILFVLPESALAGGNATGLLETLDRGIVALRSQDTTLGVIVRSDGSPHGALCRGEPLGSAVGQLSEWALRAEVQLKPLCSTPHLSPEVLTEAAWQHGYRMIDTWVIALTLDDVEAAMRTGARCILLELGYEQQWRFAYPFRAPHAVAPNLAAAVRFISQSTVSNGTSQFAEEQQDGEQRTG